MGTQAAVVKQSFVTAFQPQHLLLDGIYGSVGEQCGAGIAGTAVLLRNGVIHTSLR